MGWFSDSPEEKAVDAANERFSAAQHAVDELIESVGQTLLSAAGESPKRVRAILDKVERKLDRVEARLRDVEAASRALRAAEAAAEAASERED